jgi:hypothetical protein
MHLSPSDVTADPDTDSQPLEVYVCIHLPTLPSCSPCDNGGISLDDRKGDGLLLANSRQLTATQPIGDLGGLRVIKASPGGGQFFPEASAFMWRVELLPGNSTFVARLQYTVTHGGKVEEPVMTMHFVSSPTSPTVSGLDITCGGWDRAGVKGEHEDGEGGRGGDAFTSNERPPPPPSTHPWRGFISGLYAAVPSPPPGAPSLTRDTVLARLRLKRQAAARMLTASALQALGGGSSVGGGSGVGSSSGGGGGGASGGGGGGGQGGSRLFDVGDPATLFGGPSFGFGGGGGGHSDGGGGGRGGDDCKPAAYPA